MSNAKTSVNISFPIFGAIGLILVILKLAGVEPVSDWSWWLVTLPFWFGIAVVAAFAAAMLAFGAIAAAIVGLFSLFRPRKGLTRRRW